MRYLVRATQNGEVGYVVEGARFAGRDVESVQFGVASYYDKGRAERIAAFLGRKGYRAEVVKEGAPYSLHNWKKPMTQRNPGGGDALLVLESLVDQSSVREVVDLLSEVCWAKVAHIEETWQDRGLTQRWKQLATKIERFATTIQNPED